MVGADEALQFGIVNKVVEDDQLRAATMEMARRIADMPQVAVAATKRNLFAAETESFATTLDMEAYNQARCSQTEDHREAVMAFKEKRRPVFKGQ
jgi:2-(1,2-epoxy-1,2-dihydrophenyl)acetyl-CoA isomerase